VKGASHIGVAPVTQQVTGWPHGDCVRASYAAIFEVPLEAIPQFDPATADAVGKEQGDLERAWLASIGYDLVEISTDHPEKNLPQSLLDCMPEVPHLMSGISPRGFGHRCVGIGGQLVFDPHPSRAGLVSVYAVGILVPLEKRR